MSGGGILRSGRYQVQMVDDLPVIQTDRLILMIAMVDHVGHIVRYLVRNREHLRPWEPRRNEAYFQEASWIGAPERDQSEARYGEAFRFRLIAKPSIELKSFGSEAAELSPDDYLGTVSLRDVKGWPMHHATIGYSLDKAVEGNGLMHEAVAAVIRFGFEKLHLRRIEACYMPSNDRSERLLAKL
ncbi:MAG: GNAT family N-acetyltransferase, partial [Fimbriimonadaceae bacterium]|nr:GNAT family N-acetyltransferase [Fimbriimonadaceae bacterium]